MSSIGRWDAHRFSQVQLPVVLSMSESKPRELGEQQTLWLFRNLVDGDQIDEALEIACDVGRVERWGHAARIPMWSGGDDVVLIVDGNVIATRAAADESVRLTRGDAFGKTAKGRIAPASKTGGDELVAKRETTICSIEGSQLREIWESQNASRRIQAGRWFRKMSVEVPVWPLLGTMPTTRIARVLLHLVEHYGDVDGDRGRLPITVGSRQLAELAGVDGARASRVWSLFERTGLVETDGGSLVLRDLPNLRQYSLG